MNTQSPDRPEYRTYPVSDHQTLYWFYRILSVILSRDRFYTRIRCYINRALKKNVNSIQNPSRYNTCFCVYHSGCLFWSDIRVANPEWIANIGLGSKREPLLRTGILSDKTGVLLCFIHVSRISNDFVRIHQVSRGECRISDCNPLYPAHVRAVLCLKYGTR